MLKIQKYSHGIKVLSPDYETQVALTGFAAQLVGRSFVKEDGKQVLKPTHVFASRTKDKQEYWFHVNQLNELKGYLGRRGYDISQIEVTDIPIPEPTKMSPTIRSEWSLRDYQQEAVAYLNEETPFRTKLVELRTGAGKTISALFGIAKRGYRTAIVILPQYIEKWINDIHTVFDIPLERLMVVQGSAQLKGLIELAQTGRLDADFIIISSRTMQMYVTDYEEQEDFDYEVVPQDLMPTLGIGTLLIDEAHQHLHVMYKNILYSHVPLLIGLTATLITDSQDIARVHQIMYPPPIRFDNLGLDRYTDVYAFSYNTHDFKNAKLCTTEWGAKTYSHNAYEKSILANKQHTKNYLKIVDFCVGHAFLDVYQKGDKLAIFASTVKMCDTITQYLARHYGDQFDIRRYCESDPYENAIEPDIRVSTIQSMGTAIDIPGLRSVIMTNSISSSQSNIQVLGRLRKLPDRDTRFVFIYNEDIERQVNYAYRKFDLFRDRAKTIKRLRLPVGL